jgi:sphinganine-1-phosphate aldolase
MSVFNDEGRSYEDLLTEIETMKSDDARWAEGKTWSMVYHVDDEHKAFLQQVNQSFYSESYINPFAFKSLQRMEREVIAMAREMLNGGEKVVGSMTSGGTESIFLATYTYREYVWRQQKQKHRNEIVAPHSIHPAFEKAAHILGLKVRKAKLTSDYAADVEAMKKLVNNNTLMLAASAPSYPHGIIDPIPEIAAIAQKNKLPLHIDACIGGFMLPWVEAIHPGSIPEWDFRLEGITSISADTHKFGYGGKGSSVLLYKSMDYLRHQFFITTDWEGGIYASSTFLGSRSGGPIATAWASLQSLGREGYINIAKAVMKGTSTLKSAIAELPELELVGQGGMNILAFTSGHKEVDIFVVADYLESKGWYVDRQQRPNCIHLTVMKHNLTIIPNYIEDLKEAIAYSKAHPEAKKEGNAALYGLMARLPLRGMVKDNVRGLFEQLYDNHQVSSQYQEAEKEGKRGDIPATPRWMGWLNHLLSKLPRKH